MKTIEQAARNYAERSIRAYLNNEKGTSEKWIAGVLVSSGVDIEALQSILFMVPQLDHQQDRFQFLEKLLQS